jgi:hypothetical protein
MENGDFYGLIGTFALVARKQFGVHCNTKSVGHAHCTFCKFEVHGLWSFDGDIKFDRDFFASCIRSVISFEGYFGSLCGSINNVIILEG